MKWEDTARAAMARVPFFVRQRVTRRVESEARSGGADTVRLEHVQAARRRFIDRMEDEVRGWRVETCFGSGGCPNRAVEDDRLAGSIEGKLRAADLKACLESRVRGPLKMHHEFRVSISNCPNACSRPQIADLGLIGACRPRVRPDIECSRCRACVEACPEEAVRLEDGAAAPDVDEAACLSCGRCIRVCPSGTLDEAERGWRVQIGGRLGRRPRLAREIEGLSSLDEVLDVVDRALTHHKAHNRRGERFGDLIQRTGWLPPGREFKPCL